MGLAPSSDWFNSFTSILCQGIAGISKSMDDFLASNRTLQGLEQTLDTFFKRCQQLGVKISKKKFKTGSKVKFGGVIVNTEGDEVKLEVDEGKIQRILDFPSPTSKDDVASFIGLAETLNNKPS